MSCGSQAADPSWGWSSNMVGLLWAPRFWRSHTLPFCSSNPIADNCFLQLFWVVLMSYFCSFSPPTSVTIPYINSFDSPLVKYLLWFSVLLPRPWLTLDSEPRYLGSMVLNNWLPRPWAWIPRLNILKWFTHTTFLTFRKLAGSCNVSAFWTS